MNLSAILTQARDEGSLLPSAYDNLLNWLSAGFLPDWAVSSLKYLIDSKEWVELNDRFYTRMAFGTGGLRGRTIGKVIPPQEQGVGGPLGAPEHPAVGTAYLNDFNVAASTIGLFYYTKAYLEEQERSYELPKLVIAYDVRHFSKHFCHLVARIWERLGGIAYVFDGPRSTPQLSFSVRYLKATAGIVITASHNPPHDNGYKVYFEDGGQIVSPHAEGIMKAIEGLDYQKELALLVDDKPFTPRILPFVLDEAFLEVEQAIVLDKAAVKKIRPTIVYTAIHGTGQVAAVPSLERLGVNLVQVKTQAVMDGRFPTVKSPNPENPEALSEALALAKEHSADAVLGTDPDGDRMGAAIRLKDGSYCPLTGNQIGTLLAEHRIRTLKAQGWLPENGSPRAALIKTFVTTPLQSAIAKKHGLKMVETLTGFKWIGAKLNQYESILEKVLLEEKGLEVNYDKLSLRKRAELHQKYSTFYVFGGEESYGTLATDFVRDKDATGACVLFAEMVAVLKNEGKTVEDFLNEIYLTYGYYDESLLNLVYEGAAGASKIQSILKSYRENPPKEVGGVAVAKFTDFGRLEIKDADGDIIPPQDFFYLELADGTSYAVRGSGTEPKIKFYLFAHEPVSRLEELIPLKAKIALRIDDLKAAIRAHAEG